MRASFVPLGQLIKFAFEATGVLPRKRSERNGLSDLDIKRIQKQLERLVDEEGGLSDRCGELIKALSFEITGTVQNIKVNFAIGETLMDLLEVYNAVIRDNGTYLLPKESLRWFCEAHAIPRLVISSQKHVLRFNVAAEGFGTPSDADWYLPTFKETSVTWPLEKAMNWVYKVCNTSRAGFHKAGKKIDDDDSEGDQNLENASNWIAGKVLPSWPGLHWNFSRSIDRLVAAEGRYRRSVSETEKEGILYVLFLARLSTFVTKQLHDAYGAEVLNDMVCRFKRHREWLAQDLYDFKTVTASFIKQSEVQEADVDKIWLEFSDDYWSWFAERDLNCAETMQRLIFESREKAIPEDQVAKLCEAFGDYAVRTKLDSIDCASRAQMPEHFMEALGEGFDMKKSSSTTEEDVDAYEAALHEKGLDDSLGWMVYWIRGVIHYRNQQDENAFMLIQKAFDLAKYSAGKNQYEIVNMYIDLAAKCGRWKCFKRGVAWASYLGISVRWLRDEEPTEGKLREVFEFMKLVRYGR